MLKQLQKTKNEQGFTIIEVLIVLAIAALILVIVLIAIPNLQRNQRNTARKDEASRILTAANTYVSNNNGTALTAGNSTQSGAIKTEAGTLQQYSALTGGSATSLTANQLNIASGAVTPTAPASDAVLLVTGATCDTTTPGNTVAASSSRSMVVVYTTEKSGGGFNVLCIGS